MAEIVRVLKWRLDLEGGLADGLEKTSAAADKLAAAGAKIAATAPSALKATAAAAKEADTAFEGLGLEAKQVEMFVSRLEKGAGSPLVLKRNAEQAEAAFNVLAAAAGKAGVTISESFSDRVINAISKGTTQAARMNAELEKLGGQTPTKLDKVIVALEKTATASGSATTALKATTEQTAALGRSAEQTAKSKEKLGDSMRKSTEGINKFRGAAMETWAVLQIGKDAGNALAAAIDKQSASMAAHDKRMNDAAVNTIKFEQAMKLAERGLISLGGTQEQFLARYDAYIAKTNPAIRATEAQTKALKEQQQAFVDLGKQMEASAKSVEFKINAPKVEDLLPIEEATKYAARLADILKKAFKEGGATERDAWAAANQEAIEKVIASYQKFGAEVPAILKEASTAMGLTVPILDVSESTERTLSSLRLIRTELESLRGVSDGVTGDLHKLAGGFGAVAAASDAAAGSGGEQVGAPVTVPVTG